MGIRKLMGNIVLAFGLLEWTYVAVLVALVAATGAFFLFLILQLFRAHSRR